MRSAFKNQPTDVIVAENSNLSCFGNQVSGHSCLLKGTTPHHIYKPYNRNEAEFYEFLAKQKDMSLKDFIPAYYGVMTLPKPKLEEVAIKLRSEEHSNADSGDDSADADATSESSTASGRQGSTTSNGIVHDVHSKSEWFKDLFEKRFNRNNTRFLKLQDLTSEMETPCLLDLKMGSVAYNADKLAHQASKLKKTTSSPLKFRICGLQVKNSKTDTEYFRDKYWGRSIKPDMINGSMALFFYDGEKIRRNLIKQFLRSLEDLAKALKSSYGFKFYSVSLLLTYDSEVKDKDFEDNEYTDAFLKDKFNLRLIDFAKSVYTPHSEEIDLDLLAGVENLIKCLREIQENSEVEVNLE